MKRHPIVFPVFFVHIPAGPSSSCGSLPRSSRPNLGLFSASATGGGVAFFAHVGGFLFGLAATWVLAKAGQVTPEEG